MKIKFQFNRIIEAINKNLIEPQKQLEIRLDRLLDPHQRGMVVAKGMERPFTAEFWNMFINSKNTVLQCDSKYQALKVMQHSFSITNSVKIIDTKEKYVMLEQQRGTQLSSFLVSELLIIH